ncbi:unnamed protein product [Rotaria sp. Silwood1]|nr:unnamed protein product [Rotaria sp. Silwood1]
MVLHLYIDWLSQPSRAVAMLLMENNIEHQVHEISCMQGETQSAEYKQVNPAGKVPSIVDNDFHLDESHTIMRYICVSRNLPDYYYPNDIKQRARVDYWLDWDHMNLRHGSMCLIRANLLAPIKKYSQQTIDELRKEGDAVLKSSLSFMEEAMSKNNYIAGGNQLSIADIALACEVIMLPIADASYKAYPNIEAWLKRLSTEIKCWYQVNAKLDQFLASKGK